MPKNTIREDLKFLVEKYYTMIDGDYIRKLKLKTQAIDRTQDNFSVRSMITVTKLTAAG